MTWKVKERHGMHGMERKFKARQERKDPRKGKGRQGKARKAKEKRKGKERLGIDHILCCGCSIHLAYCTFIHGVGYLGIHTCGVVACMHILGGNIPCGHLAFELA
jgi:hypothetical protein